MRTVIGGRAPAPGCAYGRGVWARAKQHGARPVCTYMLLVLVGGRAESPVLAAETLKPLIDAGTDEGMWPDDDPAHRVMTLYAPDPRRLAAGVASIHMLVVPVPHSWGGWRALDWLLDTVHAGMGAMRMLAIGDADWLTSNMRLPQAQRKGASDACDAPGASRMVRWGAVGGAGWGGVRRLLP